MKKLIIIIGLFFFSTLFPAKQVHAQIDIINIINAGIKKAIKAVDLKIQRLQNKTIWLQNAQKAIENTMSKLKLNEITEWVQKQKDLYQDYFDELRKVKNTIAYYHRIKEMTNKQLQLVAAYKRAFGLFKTDKHFSKREVDYMAKVYAGILDESIRNLDEIFLVVTSFSTQMDDLKRLEIIDKAANAIDENYSDLLQFNQQNISLSLKRSKDLQDINQVRILYGLQ